MAGKSLSTSFQPKLHVSHYRGCFVEARSASIISWQFAQKGIIIWPPLHGCCRHTVYSTTVVLMLYLTPHFLFAGPFCARGFIFCESGCVPRCDRYHWAQPLLNEKSILTNGDLNSVSIQFLPQFLLWRKQNKAKKYTAVLKPLTSKCIIYLMPTSMAFEVTEAVDRDGTSPELS